MIIKLSGANFASKNLGTIDVSELSASTISLLSKYSKSLTTVQKFALQDFIKGLQDNGIWNVLNNLYLPILAGNLSESLFNVKSNVLDVTPSSGIYALSASGGIKNTGTAGTTVKVPFSGSQRNLHALMYNAENFGTMSFTENFMDYNQTVNSVLQMINPFIDTGMHLGVKTDTNVTNTNAVYVASTTPKLQGVVQRADKTKFLGTSVYETATVPATDNTYSNVQVRLMNDTGKVTATSYGLFSLGGSLSDAQITTYRSLADTFMRTMGVAV